MNKKCENLGYVLFGYTEGFRFHDKAGCALDFFSDDQLYDLFIKSILIQMDSITKLDQIYARIHLDTHDSFYSIYATYYGSTDFIGRTAYNGCALILKSVRMDTHEILSNLEIITDSANLNSDTIILTKNTLTYENDTNYDSNKYGTSTNIGFIESPINKETIYKFFEASKNTNFYKTFLVSENIFKNRSTIQFSTDFFETPLFYIDHEAIKKPTVNCNKNKKELEVSFCKDEQEHQAVNHQTLQEILEIKKLIYTSNKHAMLSLKYLEKATRRLSKMEDKHLTLGLKKATDVNLYQLPLTTTDKLQKVLLIAIIIFAIITILFSFIPKLA